MKRRMRSLLIPLIAVIAIIAGYFLKDADKPVYSDSVMNVPAFSGEPYVVINNNEPEFTDEDMVVNAYEFYSELDASGRCGYTMACIGAELMPTEERGNIGQVKPSGWQTVKYDFVDGKYLYNRCHLIGFQLTGENDNEQNLITGTRYLNVEGMLPFENMIADYIKETGNHVIYRVTPIFDGNNLVARGVQMEAKSVEDGGEGICFNVYAYNNQPGVAIDYTTGESTLEDEANTSVQSEGEACYILNISSKKFHTSSCEQAQGISESNREAYTGDAAKLIEQGYAAAKCCDPQQKGGAGYG